MRDLILLPAILLLATMATHGQGFTTPFYSSEGVPTAQERARVDLAADAELIFIGSLGDFTIPAGGTIPIDLHLGFYLDSARGPGLEPPRYPGQADAWIYLFRSADSGRTLPLIVVKILGAYQAQSFQGFPFPSQFGAGPLRLGDPYSGSGEMTRRLKENDDVFQVYHAELPGSSPDVVTYGQLVGNDSVQFPVDFLNGPAWTMVFAGGRDTSMTCFVSAMTGATFCQRVTLPPLSAPREATTREGSITILSTPSADRVQVVVASPPGKRADENVRFLLYDALGRMVRDGGDHSIREGQPVDLHLDGLPAGVYYLLALGTAWRATAGIDVR